MKEAEHPNIIRFYGVTKFEGKYQLIKDKYLNKNT